MRFFASLRMIKNIALFLIFVAMKGKRCRVTIVLDEHMTFPN